MKHIRTKIVLLLILMSLLPLIPVAITVNSLVKHSLRLGVNPEIENALESGVDFSKELYQLRREQLLSQVWEIGRHFSKTGYSNLTAEKLSSLLGDAGYWEYLLLAVLDKDGNVLRRWRFTQSRIEIRRDYLQDFFKTGNRKHLFRDEKEGLFSAVYQYKSEKDAPEYLYLSARMRGVFFDRARQLQTIRKLYTTLGISLNKIPGTFLYSFLSIYGLVVILAIFIGVWISSKISAPIKMLVGATEEIGRGNLDYQVEIKSRDEIGQLMRHFNRMAKNLKENQERMIYLEKMAAWQEIARRLAHEIKNPLTPIRLTIQQIVDSDPHTNEEYSKLLNESYQIINEEIGSLHRLVTEFSEFGKMPELNLQKDDLRALITDVAALYSHRQIQLKLPGNPVEISFDWDRIKRVFINLLENAVQADPENRPIVISLSEGDGDIRIEVRDEGPGIAEELLPRIFEPYFSTKKSGVGLGLAITRKMVEEHGGRISVDSAPGKGTCFRIILPKR